MNSRHIHTFNTKNFWAMPLKKPTRGKPVKEILLIELLRKRIEFTTAIDSTLNTVALISSTQSSS
jgi:hypothetical protein